MVLHPATSAENASCTTSPWQKNKFLHPATSIDNASCTTSPWQKKIFLHPATSIDNASCTTSPWQKKFFFCTLPPQLIMPPAPLPPGNNSFISLYAKVSFSP